MFCDIIQDAVQVVNGRLPLWGFRFLLRDLPGGDNLPLSCRYLLRRQKHIMGIADALILGFVLAALLLEVTVYADDGTKAPRKEEG